MFRRRKQTKTICPPFPPPVPPPKKQTNKQTNKNRDTLQKKTKKQKRFQFQHCQRNVPACFDPQGAINFCLAVLEGLLGHLSYRRLQSGPKWCYRIHGPRRANTAPHSERTPPRQLSQPEERGGGGVGWGGGVKGGRRKWRKAGRGWG